MLKVIILTAAQWTDWQASADYRKGFEQGVYMTVDPDIGTIQLMQPDGTTQIAIVKRETTWV